MSEVSVIEREALKQLLLNIVEIERERQDLRQDQAELKLEMRRYVADSRLIKYLFIVGLQKNYKEQEVDYLNQASLLLGKPAMCELSFPNEVTDPVTLENRKNILSIIERWSNLDKEKKFQGNELRGLYAQAKAKGISIPCIKKLVDFCLNPSKLQAYRENNPLLEAYIDATQDVL